MVSCLLVAFAAPQDIKKQKRIEPARADRELLCGIAIFFSDCLPPQHECCDANARQPHCHFISTVAYALKVEQGTFIAVDLHV